MANISQQKRQKMLEFLNKLKQEFQDDDKLRAINEIEIALSEKKYGLVWEKHTEKVDEMLEHNIPVFKEVKERKIVADESKLYNFLLEGDNLHSLKLLLKTHKGRIDVIYIDPPYNTGNKDFIYNDSFVDKTDAYSHSKWLSFMSERLELARELLSEEGVIFISIDDNEQAQLKLLCDEIFGEENFVANIVVESGGVYGPKTAHKYKTILKVKDYCLSYFKNSSTDKPRSPLYDKVSEAFDPRYGFYITDNTILSLSEYLNTDKVLHKGFKKYNLEPSKSNINRLLTIDNDIREYFYSSLADKIYKDSQFTLNLPLEVLNSFNPGEVIKFKNYTLMKMSTGNVRHLQSFAEVIRKNDEINEEISRCVVRGDLWKNFSKDMGNVAKEGSTDFKNGKKPIRLIKQFIKWSNMGIDSIILDFFAGSGTTGHAVAQLNKQDGGNRKYILCTNNENNICEQVTYQRLKNIQSDLPHNLKYLKTEFIPKFDNDDTSISSKMLEFIKELIELQHHVELDDTKHIIVNSEEEFNNAISSVLDNGKIFIRSGILVSSDQQTNLKARGVEIITIPDYYFKEELKEIGELW
ncbi:site-specific DNA-methyltransferase [Mycoplasma simbae]|uniref:site-specific DNA-methyltransferase n=1 Tax=Mycoplasma simbae TaxID=36744 RepID=UPI000498049A|nr:site-specific DNA-methyltransferase [Mycoplasma simbae]